MKLEHAREPLERVLSVLAQHAGLSFPLSRRPDAHDIISRLAEHEGARSLEEYAGRLEQAQARLDPLVEALTVGETYFFRDQAQFEFIRNIILPDIVSRKPGGDIRIWSAGCASGEEPYSIAILLDQEGLSGRASIIGTDISEAALQAARAASYKKWSFRGCDPGIVSHYFRKKGDRHALLEPIREQVSFARFNLASDSREWNTSAPDKLDLILLRNVLIYFDPPLIRKIAAHLHERLVPGGWLVTGASDPLLDRYAGFETVVFEGGIMHRRPLEARKSSSAQQHTPREPAASEPDGIRPAPVSARKAAPSRPARRTARRPISTPPQSNASDPAAAAIATVRKALRERPAGEARLIAAESASTYPDSPGLQLLHGISLMQQNRADEAIPALRRALYLDRTLAIGHFTLAVLLRNTGAIDEAKRSLRNAEEICARHDPDEPVPMGDGEIYSGLHSAIRTYHSLLGGERRGRG